MNRLFLTWLSALSLPLISFGCSGDTGDPLPAVSSIEPPEQFTQGQQSWQRAVDLQADDQSCLAKFFSTRPDLAGSPEVTGNPILYKANQQDRKFYWISPTASGSKWACVTFQNRKFTFKEGDGSPFNG